MTDRIVHWSDMRMAVSFGVVGRPALARLAGMSVMSCIGKMKGRTA